MREALRISRQANLEILHDTISYLKKHVDEVIFDAEHFFDGYALTAGIALDAMKAVDDAGRRPDLPVRYQRRTFAV